MHSVSHRQKPQRRLLRSAPGRLSCTFLFGTPPIGPSARGGVANKIADTLVWVLFPVFFRFHGLSVVQIGWITGVYAMVWGLGQFGTGHLADRIGRRPPILAGFALLAAGLAGTALVGHFTAWIATAAVMGLGMALLYPNLIAAMSDVAPPLERGRILGTYRYWRDTGYAIGGLVLGVVAQWSDKILPAIWFTAGIVAFSGLWIALSVQETHPRTHAASTGVSG
ncbi:MAG: MFS transporter [Acidithiobacillus caldus]|uniref:MFS transporter n=1 Tax=Acidithiobacillus caldus TaxID=33059 RepID=UPI002815D60B|nr:MFS transporter [Acidithiobacillus caldus]WMT47106.1 MAG: MFS transporter [Acidithiobacillus caldus]